MSEHTPGTGTAVHDGTPAYCSACECPLVVYESRAKGYHIVCGCEEYALDINDTAASSSLFTPLSGRWSNVDDITPWDDIDL